ncbi:MAG: hypothetical protein H7A37_07275 [Chlamydiales bacterium]|nr:hypothetical protein [Chlamydiia bacterium]MCP5508084.1 hypothetical protein [Chlamydiales bacterium]
MALGSKAVGNMVLDMGRSMDLCRSSNRLKRRQQLLVQQFLLVSST